MNAHYRTIVYVDGFNFYYGQVRGTPHCAVVVSNDSDLAESPRLVKAQHRKVIGLVTPGAPKRKTSRQLQLHADFVKPIRTWMPLA